MCCPAFPRVRHWRKGGAYRRKPDTGLKLKDRRQLADFARQSAAKTGLML